MNNCISGTVLNSTSDEPLRSRMGGEVFLPLASEHPKDKSGTPMLLLAMINFSELPDCGLNLADTGLFFVFLNSAMDYSNPKDRHAFRILFFEDGMALTPSPHKDASIGPAAYLEFQCDNSLPELESNSSESKNEKSAASPAQAIPKSRQLQILGDAGRNFRVLQEIAAFAGNGVSWSPARSQDSCYSHLLDAAPQWRLLLKINSIPDHGLDLAESSIYVLIRDEDLSAHRYDKSWLLLS